MNRYNQVMRQLRGKPIGFPRESPIHLTEQELTEIERQLGEELPPDYREFIRDFGDFTVSTAGFTFKIKDRLSGGSLERFAGFNVTGRDLSDIISSYEWACETFEEWPHDCISIAYDAGSSAVALAFKGEMKGRIYFMNAQAELHEVASSFDEFINMLHIGDNEPEAKEDAEKFWKPYLGEE